MQKTNKILIEDLPEHDIKIYVSGKINKCYTVVYGKQVTECHTYLAACNEIGSCIMHALTSEGKLF